MYISRQYTFKTNMLDTGQCNSIFQSYTSFMQVKEMQQSFNRPSKATERMLGQTVFKRTENDNKPTPSVEDTIFIFLKIMKGKPEVVPPLKEAEECW